MTRTKPGISPALSIIFLIILCTSVSGKTIYVDDDAAGVNDGTSWADAYIFLQEALADAEIADKPVEIRVAQGTYKPNGGIVAIPEFDWRTLSFQLINGVTLKGGYVGVDSPNPNARDIKLYKTILSGDLNGDDIDVNNPEDLLNEPTRADNSYHVVSGSGTDSTAMLDGFTITAGNANGSYPYSGGGGMHNDFGNPTVNDCTFSGNSAKGYGGGMYNPYGSPILTNCNFILNYAEYGGGMGNFIDSNPTLNYCTFRRNSASENGGGMYNDYYTNSFLTDCTFDENSAVNNGGGMYNHENSDTRLTDCIFMGNSCGNGGGGMWISMSNPTLHNCIFSGNSADFGGGITNMAECNLILTNCTFSGNSVNGDGGGMFNSWESRAILINCIFTGNRTDLSVGGIFNLLSSATLTNCIFWDNNSPQIAGDTVVSYSDVQGGFTGEGNIDADPLFADPNNGDYHLKSEAGRWDQASQSWVTDNVTSPCIDAGDPNSSVGNEPEPNGGRINMGAYGGIDQASMSPSQAQAVVYIKWIGHSSVKIWTDDTVVYVDPRLFNDSPHDANLVLVTHSHGDHYSRTHILRASNDNTAFYAPPDVIQQYGSGNPIAPGETIESNGVIVTGVPAYNINKPNHPKSNNWLGFIIELGGKRIYVAGDTDLIEEMKSLEDIDVAILPVGGTYTMNGPEAAEATTYIQPELAIPYHWGSGIGNINDARTFAEQAACPVKIMTQGEIISSDNWLE